MKGGRPEKSHQQNEQKEEKGKGGRGVKREAEKVPERAEKRPRIEEKKKEEKRIDKVRLDGIMTSKM